MADTTIMDAAGNQVFAANFNGCTVMIAVPTVRNAQNDVDDLITNQGAQNATIDCISIGWNANNDNMGMCPPMCAAVISNNAI